MKTVYIAGKITGDHDYREKFDAARRALEALGFMVMSPAVLPWGFPYEAYGPIDAAMLDACEYVCFLPDWKDSRGAMYEFGRAVAGNKRILFYPQDAKAQEQKPDVGSYIAREINGGRVRCKDCGLPITSLYNFRGELEAFYAEGGPGGFYIEQARHVDCEIAKRQRKGGGPDGGSISDKGAAEN